MKTRVLVTGGCGFIGCALSEKLVEFGYDVDVIDNLSIGREAIKPEGAAFLGWDVRGMESFPVSDYKYIFHLAALSRIQPSFRSPSTTFGVNLNGTRQVVDYTMRSGAKLIYAGSSSRHHNPELSPYAMTKYMGEEWIKLYKRVYGLRAEIARFYNVYGPNELVNSKMAALIGKWRAAVRDGQPLIIHGDGEQRRDFTHIDDIVFGLIAIAESDEQHDDAWELGTGKNYSINEVAKMFNYPNIEYVEDVPGNYRETLRVNDDAINRLVWKPKDRLKEYIQSLKY